MAYIINFEKDVKITIFNPNFLNSDTKKNKLIDGIFEIKPSHKQLIPIQKICIQLKVLKRQKLPTELLNSQSTPNLDDALDDVMDHPEFIETEEVIYDSSSLMYPTGDSLIFNQEIDHKFYFEFQIPKDLEEEEEEEEDQKININYLLIFIVEQDDIEYELIKPVLFSSSQ